MVQKWVEPFTYSNGVLSGRGGWTGNTSYYIDSNVLKNNQTDGSGAYLNNDSIDVGGGDRIRMMGELGCSNWDASNNLRVIEVRSTTAGGHIGGIKLRKEQYAGNTVGLYCLVSTNTWSSLLANINLSGGGLHSYDILINRATNEYEFFFFNGVNYATPARTNYAGVVFRTHLTQQSYDVGRALHDNMEIYDYDLYGNVKKKYNKFPRWQKTQYGMRPCY